MVINSPNQPFLSEMQFFFENLRMVLITRSAIEDLYQQILNNDVSYLV